MTVTRALITGAAGFLGGHLFQQLALLGWTVAGTARQEATPSLLACDITDKLSCNEIINQTMPSVIFHIAALTPAAAPEATIDDYMNVNVNGTLNLLEAARQYVPNARIMLVTSSALFGKVDADDGVIYEASPLNPVNPYGVSKATQHLIGYQYATQYKMDVIRVCPFNLIGYGLPKGLVAADFASQIVAIERDQQEPIIHVGDLSGKRDFLDVKDATKALIGLVSGGKSGEAYNLASAQAVSISDLLTDMISMSDRPIEIQPRPNIVKNAVPIQIGSHAKLTAATGWTSQISLKQSLADVLAYWRSVNVEGNT